MAPASCNHTAPLEVRCPVCVAELIEITERVKTIADEAFGPFPVQSAEEALTAIERGIFELRRINSTSFLPQRRNFSSGSE